MRQPIARQIGTATVGSATQISTVPDSAYLFQGGSLVQQFNTSRRVFVFGPNKYGERWTVKRVTSRAIGFGFISSFSGVTSPDNPRVINFGPSAGSPGTYNLPNLNLKIYRGAAGGNLLDSTSSGWDAVSDSSYDLQGGEFISCEYSWITPNVGSGGATTDYVGWIFNLYLEGEATYAISR